MAVEELIKKLNSIRLYGFKDIKIGDLLSIFLPATENNKLSWKNELRGLASEALKYSKLEFSYEKEENSKVLFFMWEKPWRKDHFDSFNNLTSCIDNKDVLYLNRCSDRKVNIIRFLFIAPQVALWYLSLLFKNICFSGKLYIIKHLVTYYEINKYIRKINISQYKLLITFADVTVENRYLVLYFKKNGIKTAVLQHGIYSLNNNMFCVAYYSISDYILLWNQFSKDILIENKMPNDKLLILGLHKYANFKNDSYVESVKKNTIGVLLSTTVGKASNDEGNRLLIETVNNFCKRTGYKYILKYHPVSETNEYDDIIDVTVCVGKSEKHMSIVDYVKTVDFSVMIDSGVYIDLIFLNHPVYRLVSDSFKIGVYDNILNGKFSSVEELMTLISDKSSNNMQNLFDYLCTTRNIADNYKDFIAKHTR